MLAYLRRNSSIDPWYIIKTEAGKELYLHKNGTWHPTTAIMGEKELPGLFRTKAAAVLVVASVAKFVVAFGGRGSCVLGRAFSDAERPLLALEEFLMRYFGLDGKVTNSPPPKWARVYRSEDALDLANAQLLVKWDLPE